MSNNSEQINGVESAEKTELTRHELARWIRNTLLCALALVAAETTVTTVRDYRARSEKDYKANPELHGKKDSWKYECIIIEQSFRTNMRQTQIYADSLVQGYVSAKPCFSFHETAQAGDVKNWYQAQKYLEKHGLVGGTRGIYRDPWHFSRGEMTRGGYTDAGMQMAWWTEQWLIDKVKERSRKF